MNHTLPSQWPAASASVSTTILSGNPPTAFTPIVSSAIARAKTSIGVGIGIGISVAVIVLAGIVVVWVRYRLAVRKTTRSEGPTESSVSEFSLMTYTNNMELTFGDGELADSLYMDVVQE
jgi:hypothetical protein